MSNQRFDIRHAPAPRESFRLLYISKSRFGGDWNSTTHTHACTEMVYCVSGRGQFNIEGKLFDVAPDDLIIVNPRVQHTELSYQTYPLEYIVLGIDGAEFLFNEKDLGYTMLSCGMMREELLFLMRMLLREIDSRADGCEMVCQDILEVLLVKIVREAAVSMRIVQPPSKSKECAAAKRYIDENFSENITLDKLAEIWETDKKTPAIVEFVDIAGLVKGASQGAGLGNKFLENIRRTDAIVHVVRCFDDENIMHVVADAGTNVPVDPLGDIETIDMELILADLEMVNRRVEKAAKAAKGDKKFLHEAEVFKALAEHLDAGKSARTFSCGDDDRALVETCDLLSLKPIIYAANMDEAGFADYENNRYFRLVRDLAQKEGAQVLPICAKLEQDIAELDDPEERAMFLEDLGIEKSGLDRLIQCSYDLLGLISFLTYGKDECRAWTIRKGTKAPQAAGKIHSDIERGFIRAETINFDEMMACGGSVAAAKEKGLLRSEGKDYVVKDGDMIYFRFNV